MIIPRKERITIIFITIFLLGIPITAMFSNVQFSNISVLGNDQNGIETKDNGTDQVVDEGDNGGLPQASSPAMGDWLDLSEQSARWLEAHADKIDGYSWNESGVYYYNQRQGAAGIGELFLKLYEKTKNSTYLTMAEKVGDWFNAKSPTLSTPGRWPEYNYSISENYTGLEHGSAGVGLFLYHLYKLSNNSTYKGLADDVYNYLNSVAQSSGNQTKYPKKESLIINGEQKTMDTTTGIYGSSSSPTANLAQDDDTYYTVSSQAVALQELNDYDSTHFSSYSLGSLPQYLSDAVKLSQQFRLDSYPLTLSQGVKVMVYADAGLSGDVSLRVGIFEALSSGYPNESKQIGGYSDPILWSSMQNAPGINAWETFSWSSNTPTLNGSSRYGYCLLLEITGSAGTGPNYFFRAAATTDSSYSKGKLSLKESNWYYASSSNNLVFNITGPSEHHITWDFSINLTDFGLPAGFDANYISNIGITCNAKTSAVVSGSKIYLYKPGENSYEDFGDIINSEQQFTKNITGGFYGYLSGLNRKLTVRITSGDAVSHQLEVDLLNVTLYYSDEFYGFDKAYGAAGIGEYYLGLYSLSPENTTFLEKAQKVANYIINNAIITVQNGLKCASWDFGFNEYYTSLSTGVAGVGEFLLDFSQKNHTDTIYNTFARYAGNWLIANMITLGVKDHNGNDIGTGAYWKESNSSTAVQSYNGYSTGIAGIADFLLKLGLANTVQNSNNRYIDAAIKAGNYLISSYTSSNTPSGAIWDKYMYSWDVNAFSQSKSDLSLEQGTAGIIIFLDNLYLVTHNINYSKAASGAYLYLKTYKTADNPTFYWNVSGHSFILYGNARGQSGIASALLKVYFDSKVAVDAAKDALDYLWSKRVDKGSNRVAFPYSASDSTQYNGLAFGTAGAGMGYLSLYKKTSNIDYFNKAYQCAHFLESSSNWYISVGSTENAYGIETGVAGIGLFFLEMTMTSNDTLYNNTLLSIADYLIGHRKQSGDQSYWDYSNSDTTAYFGWDKGAAGIMYFFTELYKFTANKTYLDVAEGVARWLDSADTSGLWTEYFGGGNTYYGFSRGAAGIGYALLDLYEVTANTTYWNLIDNIKNSLVAQISSMSIPSSPSDSHKYSGIKDGQAGMVKFFSQYYKFTYSSSIKTYLDNFINWFSNNQQSAGNFPYYAGASTYYNDYQKGCAGIIGALMESYEYSINPSSLTIIANIQNYLINHQLSDNSWNDNSDNNVYYGYYYGLAGIADQLMNTPDFQSPSLQVWNFNKSLSSIQYFDSLDVTIKTEDSVSSINNSYLLYSINGSSTWYQITFNSKQDSYYEAIIPQYRYNTHIDFFIVSIDNSGLVSIDSNNLALYSYTVLDLIPPQIIYFKTYDINNTEAKIQYATGGVIRIKVDEPDYASRINYVQIHYDNTKVVGDEITAYMTAVPGMAGLYQIVIPGTNYVYGDPFIYTITIADKQGNINTTGQINTTIGDNKLPNIDYDNLQFGFSTKIPAFTRAEVKVPVYDDNDYQGASGIAEVYLNYTSNNGLTWSKVSLSYSSTEDKYVGAIPGQNLGRIYFMICVVDKAGNIAYFDSRGVKYSDPSEIVTSLYFTYEVTINWVLTLIIVGIIAAIILLIFYIYTKKGDYWDRMRRRAEASAKMISIQERFSNAYYAIVEWLNKIGNKILSKFQRAPGMPSPIKVWYEEKLGESGRKILSAIGHTFKALFKATIYVLVSPFILLAWLVRKTGGLQAFWTALIGLLLIIANVVKYVSEPPYPDKALFFVNFGFILFISAFVLLIFHLLYRIAYK